MARKYLSADGLYKTTMQIFKKIPDKRNPEKTGFSLPETLMSGLSIFALKSPSLLAFDREIRNSVLKQNIKTCLESQRCPMILA